MEEVLWPARNVAEYAYCPRLFYLMEVEGIHLPSVDTEEGVTVHRRVDRPSADPNIGEESDPARPRSVRSLALTSSRLGLTATLDLAELQGKVAKPVEYRKGRPRRTTLAPPPDDPGEVEEPPLAKAEPWPTDRVQVGLQALLLEEAGYQVTEASLYYAAERIRVTIPVDEALRKDALDTLDAAKRAAIEPRPLPLLNDSRCVKCSLQPICLPDEVNHQLHLGEAGAEQPSPRKIWPARDDGIHVVAQAEGTKIGVRGLSVRITDRQGLVVKEFPLANLESLAILGSVQVSTQAIQAFADRGVPIAFLSAAGRLIAMVDPLDSVSAGVRRAQVKRLDDPEVAMELSRSLISAKISNQRTLLLRNFSGIDPLVLKDLANLSGKASNAIDAAQLRGYEGQAAALYFGNFAGMLGEEVGKEFDANGRKRRPPPDPVNACLSFAYTMLSHECVAALRVARLEPAIGGFHVSRPGRPALALDLMEPFRPLVGDSVAIAAFNRGELSPGHFLRTAAGCAFTDHGRKAFFNAYGRRMNTEVTHPVFEYRLSYRRMLALHARMIAAWLLGEVPTLAFLTTR